MITVDLAVVGAGAAGLAAGIEASRVGARVVLLDENMKPGGQLFKQIHKFFGSHKHYAGTRGYDIGKKLLEEAGENGAEVHLNSSVCEVRGKELTVVENDEIRRIRASKIIFASGASEKVISFPGWTLPMVMGAGAAQTMVNVYRVLPGRRFLVVGSGNIGLIVSYQLLQAGAEVVAIVEALPHIGGYGVHAAKVRRAGIPIMTSHTIKEAYGKDRVEAATVVALDTNMRPIPNSELRFDVDVVCLAVGLKPNLELPLMAGCKTMVLPALGGRVPIHDENMETTIENVYVAGDVAGIEEASTAIEQGRLAGIAAAHKLGYLSRDKANELRTVVSQTLSDLRSGPFGEQRRLAKQELVQAANGIKPPQSRVVEI
jgi:thioredoxin reductase